MIECTLSFSDLTHTQARTMAVDNNCESSYNSPYHDFTAWFDHRDEADTWAAELFKYGKNISATMVACVINS